MLLIFALAAVFSFLKDTKRPKAVDSGLAAVQTEYHHIGLNTVFLNVIYDIIGMYGLFYLKKQISIQ